MEILRNLPQEDDPAALRKALLRSRRDQADLRCLIENTSDGIWSMDLDFNVLVFNSAASVLAMKISGHPLDQGTNFLHCVPAKERSRWEKAGARIRGHEQFTQVHVMEWKSRVHRFEVSFSPIFDDAALTGMAVFCKEMPSPVPLVHAPQKVEMRTVAPEHPPERPLHGWTVLESNLKVTQSEFADASVAGGTSSTGGTLPAPSKTLRVLVCEDNPINQLVMVKMLEGLGCVADVAGNGREALKICRAQEFDLVLMDCQMPELDGFATTARLRLLERRGCRRPWIVAMTADVLKGTREKCLGSGMDGYLSKPVVMDRLKAVLIKAGWHPDDSELPVESMAEEALMQRHGVDLRMVNRLRSVPGNDVPGRFAELLRLYLAQADHSLSEMKKLLESQQFSQLAAAAHGLKGLSLNFGALRVARSCESLQCQAEAESVQSLDAWTGLRDALERTGAVFSGLAKRQWELSPPLNRI